MGSCVSVEIEPDHGSGSFPEGGPASGPKGKVWRSASDSNRELQQKQQRQKEREGKDAAVGKAQSAKAPNETNGSLPQPSPGKGASIPPLQSVTVPEQVDDNQDRFPSARRMQLKVLLAATRHFDRDLELGKGSFGTVYKGEMDESAGDKGLRGPGKVQLAVKRLDPESFQGYDEWLSEVRILSNLRHQNLVRLVGYCAEGGEALLAYELCPKGALDTVLFSDRTEDLLLWDDRVRVALDVARGLTYLHSHNVIHRDLKPSNILLREDMVATLTDFGMAKIGPQGEDTHVSTRVLGTLGYLDPAYMITGRVSKKSDAYSFGVVLLELLTGQRAGGDRLVKWATPLLNQRRLCPDLIDPRLEDNYDKDVAKKLASMVKLCIVEAPFLRPEMSTILEDLEKL